MNLFNLIKIESEQITNRILIYTTVSGLANAAILAIIIGAASTVSSNELNYVFLFLFILALAINIVTQRYLFDTSSTIIENIVNNIRTRMTEKLRRAELVDIDQVGKAEIYNRLTQHTTEISQSSGVITAALQSAVMVAFAIMYLATLSLYAFALTIIIVCIGITIYLKKEKYILQFIHKTNDTEVKLFDALTHLLDGFKEVKLSVRRGTDLTSHIDTISSDVRDYRIKTEELYNWNYIFAQSFFYVLVAVMVFILPRFVEVTSDSVTEIAAVILFIIGPLSTVVSGFPAYTRANIAVQDIEELERQIDQLNGREHDFKTSVYKKVLKFNKIILDKTEFSYYDSHQDKLFKIGPVDLTISRGETLFIVGGNGSGKSTLLKMLTGLYRPENGTIFVDNVPVGNSNTQEYRELFSAIFSDFHLFDRLYGLKRWNQEMVEDLIDQMELTGKTEFNEGEFTNLQLSTGQRKRIAMIVTLLEERPVYVFDEWAAEQDPDFRDYFYYELIPSLKRAGKTLIVVTHDKQYMNTADRIIRMEYGQIVPN